MSQGFKHSPNVFNQCLKQDREDVMINSTLIQFVDDLLLCSAILEGCYRESIKLQNKLAKGGHKTSQAKLQYCQPQVEYLDRVISHETISVAHLQLEGVSKTPQSQTVGQMTFLGMTDFSSEWLEDYANKIAPLRELIKETGSQRLKAPLDWTNE